MSKENLDKIEGKALEAEELAVLCSEAIDKIRGSFLGIASDAREVRVCGVVLSALNTIENLMVDIQEELNGMRVSEQKAA